MKLLIFSLSLFLMSALRANDVCEQKFSELHSQLDQKSKDFKFIKPERKDYVRKILTQTARLKSGEQVIYSSDGCTPLNYAFTYSRLTQTPMITIEQEIKYAIKLLEKTPVTKGHADLLISSLQKAGNPARSTTGIYALSCGQALCELNLSVPKKLKISYKSLAD